MYTPPYIDDTGLYIPSYSDILDYLVEQSKAIYGQDIYLEADSQDYQFLSILAKAIYDSFNLLQLVYNNRSPATAIKTALDSIVKLNGIKRIAARYSTCVVLITGIAGYTIKNGIIIDANKIKWDLPAEVTIGNDGTILSTATCQTPGAITAAIGTLTGIYTPTYGWSTVTNNVIATVGNDVEMDSALRARQANSVAIPSRSIKEGIRGALESLDGVTRVKIYENDTKVVDSNGLPANSITCIVEGGNDTEIANTIFNKKSPGVYTNGDNTINVTDEYGDITPIKFYRPTYVDVDAVVNVKALNNYTTSLSSTNNSNIVDYLNKIAIGISLQISMLWSISLLANTSLLEPNYSVLSITVARHGQAQGTSNIDLAFNEVIRGTSANITINVS